ncbi:MAG: gamma-glutamyl-gamma-aminobutyrate hydrolase family protein [Methylophilaceae bacterium]
MAKHKRPIIGIPACIKQIGDHPFHSVGAKYIDAVVNAAGCVPILLPALGQKQDVVAILELIDGVLLTGSPSNVAPERYGKTLARLEMADDLDHARDATTLPLIEAIVNAGKPILGICRGFQEMNVAFGGTLYQNVHQEAHLTDHRAKEDADLELQYGPAHMVKLTSDGYLHKLLGKNVITVNSIHGQGIEKLGKGLFAEATAPDGLVEAIRVVDAKSFALAVQWHPEWKVLSNPQYKLIFEAFGDAARAVL